MCRPFYELHRLAHQFPHIGQATGDCGSGGHGGRQQMRAPTATLTALEVAVRGGGATLA